MRQVFAPFFIAACTQLACASAFAQMTSIRDQAAIDKLLGAIPVNQQVMPYKTLLERLDSLGLSVDGVMYGAMSADEVKMDPDRIKRGDVLYRFSTTKPSERAQEKCKFWNSFSLIKRNGRWLVQDRTGNYLMQNQCSLPR